MKPAAAILLVIWSLVMVQPAFAYFGGKAAYGDCSKKVEKKSTCSKKATKSTCDTEVQSLPACSNAQCDKPINSEEEKNCKSRRCNPSLGCTAGNFYAHQYSQVYFPAWFAQKHKMIVTDDNRISKHLSECFHPPEA